MTRSPSKVNDSSELSVALSRIEEAFDVPVEHPVALVAAALLCHKFAIWTVSEGTGQTGPHVTIRSREERPWLEESWELPKGESPRREFLREKMTEANLRERERLLDFLGEFYSRRSSPIYIRLIVGDLAVGSSLLKCQGADVMALPEHEAEWAEWLKQAHAEMGDFATFLIGKRGE